MTDELRAAHLAALIGEKETLEARAAVARKLDKKDSLKKIEQRITDLESELAAAGNSGATPRKRAASRKK